MKDLASHIMDIVQNSIRAEASRVEIVVQENPAEDTLSIIIRDNGFGMDEETLKRVTDPFFTSRTVRKVGLGVPLLIQNAERTGGKVAITSQVNVGTTVHATFIHSNIDRPPLGDMGETISLLVGANPETHFIYKHSTPAGEYCFDTEEVKEILDGVPLNDPEIVIALQGMIRENLTELKVDQITINN